MIMFAKALKGAINNQYHVKPKTKAAHFYSSVLLQLLFISTQAAIFWPESKYSFFSNISRAVIRCILPLWLHPQRLQASATQQQPPHAPLWRPDEERSGHSGEGIQFGKLDQLLYKFAHLRE